MKSLSRVIKSGHAWSLHKPHKLTIRTIQIQEEFAASDQKENTQRSQFLEAAHLEAEKILEKAEEEKTRLLKEIEKEREAWQEEKARLIEEARKEGYQDGFEKGKKDGLQEYENVIESARQVVQLSKKDYEKKIEASEETIIEIAVKVAEKIIAANLKREPELFTGLVREVICEVKEYPEVKIYVHPDKYEFMLEQKEELMELFTTKTELYIFPDVNLPENGICVESPFGKIDASIDTQLEQLKSKLLNIVRED